MYDRFHLLIIDPSSESRGKLKQAALSLPVFKKVFVCSTIAEAQDGATGVVTPDVVFLSYRIDEEQIEAYIKSARETEDGQDCAYCAVLKSQDQSSTNVASGMLGGIDGFIFEPYSADNLREIAEVTAKIKKRGELRRKKAALTVIFREINMHLDAVCFYRKRGKEHTIAIRRLNEAAKNLKRFDGELFPIYVETLIEFFEQVPPPMNLSYDGASERVKARLEKRMLEELEAQYR